jgi:hypothetical protein
VGPRQIVETSGGRALNLLATKPQIKSEGPLIITTNSRMNVKVTVVVVVQTRVMRIMQFGSSISITVRQRDLQCANLRGFLKRACNFSL